MKYKFIKKMQIGRGDTIIKYDFINLLKNHENDLITNEMKKYINDLYIIDEQEYFLLNYFINDIYIYKWLLTVPNININILNNYNETPLQYAIIMNKLEIIELLLNNSNIYVNIQNKYGETILNNVIKSNNLEIFNLLIKNSNIDINFKNVDEETPLYIATLNNNKNIVEILLKKSNIEVNSFNKNGFTPLNIAINKGYNDIVEMLLKNSNINVNLYNIYGETPLHMTVFLNNNDIVEMLLKNSNIDVNLLNKCIETPLHIAILSNNDIIVEMLLKNININVNVLNKYRNTPLHIAILNNNIIIVEMLLKNTNINVNLLNNNYNTPIHLAIKNDDINIIKMLINNPNIDVNIQDNKGNTYLLSLFYRNDIVKMLLENPNINISLQNNNRVSIMGIFLKNMIESPNLLINLEEKQEIIEMILDIYIKNKVNITSNEEYIFLSCWSTINEITLNIFNKFINEYHKLFPELKNRSDIALSYFNNIIQTNNNEQYMICGHGVALNYYFIVPSNIMIIMSIPLNSSLYGIQYNNLYSNTIYPPCFINKNNNEYIRSNLKIHPYVYTSGSLIRDNEIIFKNDNNFLSFMGIYNVKQITNDNFSLSNLDKEIINTWNNSNVNEQKENSNIDKQNDFTIKYTDTTIYSLDELKKADYDFRLSDIVKKIGQMNQNKKIILQIISCRDCEFNTNDFIEDICPKQINQTSILKTSRRGSYSLDAVDMDLLTLQTNNKNFQYVFDFVKNNTVNNYIRTIIKFYNETNTLLNDQICDILKEYIKLKRDVNEEKMKIHDNLTQLEINEQNNRNKNIMRKMKEQMRQKIADNDKP